MIPPYKLSLVHPFNIGICDPDIAAMQQNRRPRASSLFFQFSRTDSPAAKMQLDTSQVTLAMPARE